jgi:5'-methylthioadenosine phosphorylase
MKPLIGIIGGTGLGDVLMNEADGETVSVDTPFGPPSSKPVVANWSGVDIAYLSRHGEGHLRNPSAVPYRANIWAMKQLGVSAIIASGATGSLREDIEPGQLVICDQVIDKTYRRDSSFFDQGLAVHVEFAEPFCPNMRALLVKSGAGMDATIHHAGTYVCMEGPQFSTKAESHMHRQWGGDLIGMTCMPEAKLAREAEICYALVALPTDYDCWRPHDPGRGHDELLREIIANLNSASQAAIKLIRAAVQLADLPMTGCRCRESLELAIWSDKELIEPSLRDRLRPLIGPYLTDK